MIIHGIIFAVPGFYILEYLLVFGVITLVHTNILEYHT